MATKNLKYFMRPELKEEQIVEVPGPIKDENGEPIMFQIKKLSQRHIDKIYDRHKVIRNALDKKGKPYIVDGKRSFVIILRHIVKSLQNPLSFRMCTTMNFLRFMGA